MVNVYVSNTNMLELFRLKSAIEDVYIDDATVDVTINDLDGSPVPVTGNPTPWPVTLQYVSGSDGDYVGILTEDIEFLPNVQYVAVIHANAGVNRVGHWEVRFTPKVRNQ